MISKLGHLVHKPVLVSIPSIAGNKTLHRCQLIGVEAAGLWLESEDFSKIFGNDDPSPSTIFVPFAQLACLAEQPQGVGAPIHAPARTSRQNARGTATRKKN
jgi:hypothetical protein